MEQSFTLNQLVRMLYRETLPEENDMLCEIMTGNPSLMKDFGDLKKAMARLPKIQLSPSLEAIENILNNSRKAPCEIIV
jgi:hypothetical protein